MGSPGLEAEVEGLKRRMAAVEASLEVLARHHTVEAPMSPISSGASLGLRPSQPVVPLEASPRRPMGSSPAAGEVAGAGPPAGEPDAGGGGGEGDSRLISPLAASRSAPLGRPDTVTTLRVPRTERSLSEVSDEFTQQAYSLKKSTWDSLVLLFLLDSPERTIDSLVATVLFLANVIVQVLFTLLIIAQADELKEEVVGDRFLRDALAWRVGIGHHVKHYDDVTNTSLVTRVCEDYGAEVISFKQMDMYKEIDGYLDGYGPLLAGLAVFVWTVAACKDLRQAWEFLFAACALKGDKTTVNAHMGDQNYSMQSLSMSRTLVVVFTTILRLAVAGGLWYAGMLWLTYTVRMSDIILNAVALGVVFEIDELLYHLIPKDVDKLLQHMEPLPIPVIRKVSENARRRPWLLRPDARSLGLVILLFVAMGVWTLTTALPFEEQLQTSRHLFCSGETNFVYGEDPATQVVKTAGTLPSGEFQALELGAARAELFRAVLQRSGLGRYEEELKSVGGFSVALEGPEVFQEETDPSEVEQLLSREVSAAIDLLTCEDQDNLTEAGEATRSGMRSGLGLDDCSQLATAGRCGDWRVRALCPQSCRCTDAVSGIFSRYGCSAQCNFRYQQSLLRAREEAENELISSCRDRVEDFTAPLRQNFFQELQQHLIDRGDLEYRVGGDNLASQLREVFPDWLDASQEKRSGLRFTESLATTFTIRTEWFLTDIGGVDILGWEANASNVCELARFLDHLFETNLCEEDLIGGYGTLAPFCAWSCGWCRTENLPPAAEDLMAPMAAFLRSFYGEEVVRHRVSLWLDSATHLTSDVCTEAGLGIGDFTLGEGTATQRSRRGLNGPGVVGMEHGEHQILTFFPWQRGSYTFRVPDMLGGLSAWGQTFSSLQLALGGTLDVGDRDREACLTVDLEGFEGIYLEAWRANVSASDDNFTIYVECPWAGARSYCDAGLGRQYSLQEASCSSLGLHKVLNQFECMYLSMTGLISVEYVLSSVENQDAAPVGCSVDAATGTLYPQGTGRDGGECGESFRCVCSTEAPRLHGLPTACDKAVEGPCKACVEDMDLECLFWEWDFLCTETCSLICEPVCEGPALQATGPCSVTNSTGFEYQLGEWCIENSVGPGDAPCSIALGLKGHGLRSYGPLRVEYFDTGSYGATMTVNGIPYWGDRSPHGLIPTDTIVWESGNVPEAGGSYASWRMCLDVTKEECWDTWEDSFFIYCAALSQIRWLCDFPYQMDCCHCGGRGVPSDDGAGPFLAAYFNGTYDWDPFVGFT